MEIEENNSIVIITMMASVLFFGLIIYSMNIIDHYNDCELLIDTFLIICALSADLYEISIRSDGKGYNKGANTILLNISRCLRGLMLQRRVSNFLQELRMIYQSKTMINKLRRKNSVTDMLNDILVFLGKDDKNPLPRNSIKFLKKGINHTKDLIMEKRHQNDLINNQDGGGTDKFGYNHHERMDDNDALDR